MRHAGRSPRGRLRTRATSTSKLAAKSSTLASRATIQSFHRPRPQESWLQRNGKLFQQQTRQLQSAFEQTSVAPLGHSAAVVTRPENPRLSSALELVGLVGAIGSTTRTELAWSSLDPGSKSTHANSDKHATSTITIFICLRWSAAIRRLPTFYSRPKPAGCAVRDKRLTPGMRLPARVVGCELACCDGERRRCPHLRRHAPAAAASARAASTRLRATVRATACGVVLASRGPHSRLSMRSTMLSTMFAVCSRKLAAAPALTIGFAPGSRRQSTAHRASAPLYVRVRLLSQYSNSNTNSIPL